MNKRSTKDLLYEQVARIGKPLANPKRLELIELLAQGEKAVDILAGQAGIDLQLANAHLKALREAGLVQTRDEGATTYCRLSGPDVSQLWVRLRETAEAHLVELRNALTQMSGEVDILASESKESLQAKAKSGEIVVIDVRPPSEFEAGHLPFAISLPLVELERRLAGLPTDRSIVAYCRGPFCFMSDDAVKMLRARGFDAWKISDGVSEWSAAGLPIDESSGR